MKNLLILIFLSGIGQTILLAQETTPLKMETTKTINSSYLKSKRKIDTYVYSENGRLPSNTPILIVMDADYLFDLAKTYAKFYNANGGICPVILVGVYQEDRYEELQGTEKENMRNFVFEEVIPEVQKEFETDGVVSFLGHSFSADFVNGCYRFSGNLLSLASISSFIPVKYVAGYEPVLEKSGVNRYYGYSSLKDHPHRFETFLLMDSTFKASSLQARMKEFPKRGHDDIVIPAVEDFILHQYGEFAALNTEEIEVVTLSETKLEKLKGIKQERDSLLRINFIPSVENMSVVLESTKFNESVAILDWYLSLPVDGIEKVTAHYYLGAAYEGEGELDLALKNYQMSFDNLPNWVTNKEQFQENIDRVSTELQKKSD